MIYGQGADHAETEDGDRHADEKSKFDRRGRFHVLIVSAAADARSLIYPVAQRLSYPILSGAHRDAKV